MKNNAKSSITLPASELKLVNELMKSLHAKSKVEIIRQGLTLLKEKTDRKALRAAFKRASEVARGSIQSELSDLHGLNDDGLD